MPFFAFSARWHAVVTVRDDAPVLYDEGTDLQAVCFRTTSPYLCHLEIGFVDFDPIGVNSEFVHGLLYTTGNLTLYLFEVPTFHFQGFPKMNACLIAFACVKLVNVFRHLLTKVSDEGTTNASATIGLSNENLNNVEFCNNCYPNWLSSDREKRGSTNERRCFHFSAHAPTTYEELIGDGDLAYLSDR